MMSNIMDLTKKSTTTFFLTLIPNCSVNTYLYIHREVYISLLIKEAFFSKDRDHYKNI